MKRGPITDIVGIPSGEVLKCRESSLYDLVLVKFVKYLEYFNGVKIDSYVFRDDLREDIKSMIFYNIKIGDKIFHQLHGYGRITGVIASSLGKDGYAVTFGDNRIEFELQIYVNLENLLKGNLNNQKIFLVQDAL